ncbi:MAG: CPBP family intramembrane metalloprotease [Clostridia bacterium]|nr:CPBP family intramembrane metalloprotease [Clostridia bacterium]
MRKLYETKPILFAVLWIVLYCAVMALIRGRFGDDSVQMLLGLTAISTGLLLFIRANTLQGELGLDRWIRNGKKILWLIPIWILSMGNLWSGLGLKYTGINAVMATMSFLLVGFVEETVFRGFLFNGMRKTGSLTVAIIVSAVTFGMGHLINLLTGQATMDTLLQMVFAIAWGFLLTFAYLKSGSLLACILIHGIIDAASVFSRDNVVGDTVFMVATIVVAIVYCLYLSKQPTPERVE